MRRSQVTQDVAERGGGDMPQQPPFSIWSCRETDQSPTKRMGCWTSFSRLFTVMEVWNWSVVMWFGQGFFGTGTIVEVFQVGGKCAKLIELQKIECRIDDSSIAHSLSTLAWTPSGPGALPILHLHNCCCTSSTVNGGHDHGSGDWALSSSSQSCQWLSKKEWRESARVMRSVDMFGVGCVTP